MIAPVAAATVTEPVSAPEGTVIDCGRLKIDRLALVETTAPPAGAGAESVTVQVMLDPVASGVAGHVSVVTVAGAVSVIEAVEIGRAHV